MVEVNSDKHSEVSSRGNTKERINSDGEKNSNRTYNIIIAVLLALTILSVGGLYMKFNNDLQLLREGPLKATRRLDS